MTRVTVVGAERFVERSLIAARTAAATPLMRCLQLDSTSSRRPFDCLSTDCYHLEQSTSRAQTDVVHPDILAEAANFFTPAR